MKINWDYIKGFLLVIGLIAVYGFSNYKNNSKKVAAVDVDFEQGENMYMSYQMVDNLLILNGDTLTNKPKSLIDLNQLEDIVSNHPMVEKSEVYLTVDDEVHVLVKQKTPIGRIKTPTKVFYIDRLGNTMPLSDSYSARVPLVTGIGDGESLEGIYSLLSMVRDDEFLNKQIVGFHKTVNNEYVLFTRIGAKRVELGGLDDLHNKMKNLKSFYQYAMQDETVDKYKKLSLKYDSQVVCTKK